MATTNSEKKSKRLKIQSGSKWEDIVGYSRLIKSGSTIEVAGTTATNEQGAVIGKNDPFQQTMYILQKIETYLEKAGASMGDVVRTRMFVTDIGQWEEIGEAHAAFFEEIKPVATMIEVSKLINPDLLIEIEVTAILSE